MKLKLLLSCLLVLFLTETHVYSQQSKSFKPSLWLYNPQKAKDTVKEFNKLNFHADLGQSKNGLWRSSKKMDSSKHLFLVYKSKKNENMVSFIGKKSALFLEGKNLRISDSVNLEGYNESYGELLDVQFPGIEEGAFWMNPTLKDSRIFELILLDKNTAKPLVNEVRTYLGLKYGIDLIDHKQYTYNDKQLWEAGDKAYNSHIFGLATMGRFNLYPSKSVHSKDKDLIISVSKEQRKQMDEGSYVLVGTNRKGLVFNSRTKFSEKQWLAQTNKENIKIGVSIPLKMFHGSTESFSEYELFVGAKGGQIISYTAKIADSLLVFEDVLLSSSVHSILKLKEHRSDLKFEIDNNCDEFKLKLDAPTRMEGFRLDILDDAGKNVLSETSVKKQYTVPKSGSAYFDVALEYNNKRVSKRIATVSGALKAEDLKKYYTLSEDALEINLENPQRMQYKWMKDGSLIAEGNRISLSQEGSYTLTVSNSEGCTVTQNFSVAKVMNNEQWHVFPSPADISEEVQVAFELNQNAAVELAVYQSDGKLVKTLSVGTIQNGTVSLGNFTTASGVYMVVAYIDQIPQFKKIIIK